jgi:hypothetical protein
LSSNCFNFNTGRYPNKTKYSVLNSTQVGIDGGLSLELHMPVNGLQNSLSTSSGAQIFMNTNNAYINSGKGIRLSPGFSTFIGMERTISTNLPSPYSECIQATNSINGYDSYLFKSLVAANYTYNRENCANLYIQTVSIDKCGCYSTVGLNVNASARACATIVDNKCFTKVFQDLIKSNYKSSIQDLCKLTFFLISLKHTVKPQILRPGLNQKFQKTGCLFLSCFKSLKSDFFYKLYNCWFLAFEINFKFLANKTAEQ